MKVRNKNQREQLPSYSMLMRRGFESKAAETPKVNKGPISRKEGR